MFDKLSFENQVNVAGGTVIAMIGMYLVYSVVSTRDSPVCMSDYPSYTQMSFVNSKGQPLSPPELQARIGFGERGVIENGSITSSDGPEGLAFNVKVGGKQNGPGVSFTWTPSSLKEATSACLSYSFFLPHDFNFSQGGFLPGLYGTLSKNSSSSGATGFAARPAWVASGNFEVEKNLSEATAQQAGGMRVSSVDYTMSRGRWVRIDQEVVLNSPNQSNGQLKVWVDGKLLINDRNVAWRNHGGIMISGVAVDVGYAPMRTNILPDRSLTTIKFSPLQLGWKATAVKTSSN